MALGRAFLRSFKRLEHTGELVFKTKSAADDALEAVKSDFKSLSHEGRHGRTTDMFVDSLLSRAVTAATDDGFRVVLGAGKEATLRLKYVTRELRMGRVAGLLDELDFPAESAFRGRDFLDHLTRTLHNTYPDSALERVVRRSRAVREVPARLFDKTAYASADDLRSLVAADKDAARLVDAMVKTLRKGRPIVTKGLFFGFALTAGGAAAVYTALAEAAKRAEGCWRVYRDPDTKELSSCRVRYASCTASVDGEDRHYCERYPAVVRESSCKDEWTGKTPCVRCDPTGAGSDGLRVRDYAEPTDVYVCRSRPSLGDMLGQVVLDAPHVLSEYAGDVVESAGNVFGGIWSAVRGVGLWIAFGLMLAIGLVAVWRVRRSRRTGDGGYEEIP